MNESIGPKLPLQINKKNGFLVIDNYADEVKQNLRIILLTNPGERLFDRSFGVGLRNFLFENVSLPATRQTIKTTISSQIDKYLPIVRLNKVEVLTDQTIENLLYVSLEYSIPALNLNDQLTLTLE